MENNSILTANILDILFEGRNKEYGAYDLRKTYDQRINFALGITFGIIAIFAAGVLALNSNDRKTITSPLIDMTTTNVELEKEKVIPLHQKVIKKQQVKTAAVTPPIIVMDKLVKESVIENNKLTEVTIDTRTSEGPINNTPGPVEIKGSLVIEEPVKKEIENDLPFIKVEIEAKFNGNWSAYLQKAIEKNIDELTEAGESGTCIVRFVVSKEGKVSDVEAITMKGTKLAEVAVNAIRNGPDWIAAIQNGRKVNAYRQQPVTFTITE